MGPLGMLSFKSVKSMQTFHLPFFFFTTTVFSCHFGKKISFITPASFNLLTSCLIALTCSLADLFNFYFLGGNDGSTLSLWTMNSRSTSGTSYGLQANTSIFYIRNNNVSTLSSSSYLPLLENTCRHLVVFLLWLIPPHSYPPFPLGAFVIAIKGPPRMFPSIWPACASNQPRPLNIV